MSESFQDRRSTGRGGEKRDASLSTLISIYLLIIAFLVTMFSASSLEISKVGTTMEAVQAAFNNDPKSKGKDVVEYQVSADDLTENFTTQGGRQPFYQEGARVLQSFLSLEGGINIKEGQGLYIEIPANRIFIGVSHLIRPEFEEFSKEMALILNNQGPREKRLIEFVFKSQRNGSGVDNNLILLRMDSLARNLIDQGVAASKIRIGTQEDVGSNVVIGFHSMVANDAEIDFKSLKGVER